MQIYLQKHKESYLKNLEERKRLERMLNDKKEFELLLSNQRKVEFETLKKEQEEKKKQLELLKYYEIKIKNEQAPRIITAFVIARIFIDYIDKVEKIVEKINDHKILIKFLENKPDNFKQNIEAIIKEKLSKYNMEPKMEIKNSNSENENENWISISSNNKELIKQQFNILWDWEVFVIARILMNGINKIEKIEKNDRTILIKYLENKIINFKQIIGTVKEKLSKYNIDFEIESKNFNSTIYISSKSNNKELIKLFNFLKNGNNFDEENINSFQSVCYLQLWNEPLTMKNLNNHIPKSQFFSEVNEERTIAVDAINSGILFYQNQKLDWLCGGQYKE